MSNPLVSILIPCHNAAPWLEQTLVSALNQTWPHTEIVLVDDGSTDDSLAIARRYASPCVQILSQANAGAAATRQRALEACQGNYIQYLDADDLLEPDKIARQLQRLLAAEPGSVATARWTRFTGDLGSARFTPEPNWRDFSPVDYLIQTFASGSMMHPAAWLTPRAIATAAGAWNAGLSLDDDGEYFTRIVLASTGVVFCPEAISHYRSNLSQSLSGACSPAAWSSAFRVCELSTSNLLSRDSSPRSRHACALYWLRYAFAAYPHEKTLVDRALEQARRLDPLAQRPRSGPLFETTARLLGWKTAKRLRARFAARLQGWQLAKRLHSARRP